MTKKYFDKVQGIEPPGTVAQCCQMKKPLVAQTTLVSPNCRNAT